MTQPPSDAPAWVLRAWRKAAELADDDEHPGEVVLSALGEQEAELSSNTRKLNEQQQAVRQRLGLDER